jgi:ribosomal protein L19
MNAINVIEEGYKKEIPPFSIGDTVNVSIKIKNSGFHRCGYRTPGRRHP